MLAEALALLTPYDAAAVAFLILSAIALGWRIEHPSERRPSVTVMMAGLRRAWMAQFLRREARIFDATIVSSLRQSTAFFASTSLLAIGGVLALIGNPAPLQGLAREIAASEAPVLLWQLKLAFVSLFLANGFLKFVWANRVFGYASVVMGAVPAAEPGQEPSAAALRLAAQAGELNIRAAYNFNRGLRAIYFGLGALAWVAGPVALALGTLAVIWLVWSREFASIPHDILTRPEA